MQKKFSDYPRPSVTVDCIIFGYQGESLEILLLNRKEAPFENKWTIPGGFLNVDEGLEDAASRILQTKTGLKKLFLEQLYTFGKTDRDPRGRVLSVAYYTLINPKKYTLITGIAANDLQWFPLDKMPKTGFDHKEIINIGIKRLQAKVTYQPIGFELLDQQFTLTELQQLYESILEKQLDKRNFRKRIISSGMLKATGLKRSGSKNRQPELFEFDTAAYKKLLNEGFQFKI